MVKVGQEWVSTDSRSSTRTVRVLELRELPAAGGRYATIQSTSGTGPRTQVRVQMKKDGSAGLSHYRLVKDVA